MTRFANWLMRWALFWRYTAQIIVPYLLGRFWVFRDTPTWFVEEWVRIGKKPRRLKRDYPDLIEQANDELALRRRRPK